MHGVMAHSIRQACDLNRLGLLWILVDAFVFCELARLFVSLDRLHIFYAVAKNLSFTKAAQELFISQPAITRHINNLESTYGVRLFDRLGSKIELTKAGKIMLQHTEKILSELSNLEYAMHLLNNEHVGQLRLGSSTTISQYVLPPYLASFFNDFPKAEVTLINGNSRFIEHALNEHNIDLGLVEGVVRLPTLTYTPFCADELIIVAGTGKPPFKTLDGTVSSPKPLFDAIDDNLSIEEFKTMPLVMRERGSGSLDAIEKALNQSQIKLNDLNVIMYLGSTEAIKLFIQNTRALCILSKYAVERELSANLIKQVNVEGLRIYREFCFVQAPGPQSMLTQRFMDFVLKITKYQPKESTNEAHSAYTSPSASAINTSSKL